MGKFWTKIEQFWNENRVLAWILPLSGLALGLWASFWPQSPGVSIGLLALAAGVMSIRPAMHPAEKTTWVIVLVAFAILEVHAIHIGDQKAQATIDEQKKAFSDIGEGIKNSITANKGQYDSTISHVDGVLKTTQGVADLASRNLESVTGGDSYGYVIPRYATNFQDMLPQSQIPRTLPIVLMNGGSQPLTGVTVMISRFELIKPIPGMAKGMRAILGQVLPPTIMGTLSANGTLLLPYQLDTTPDSNGSLPSYSIEVTAQNGRSGEVLDIRKSIDNKSWDYKIRVWRDIVTNPKKGDEKFPGGWVRTVKTTGWTSAAWNEITPP